ncbi:hypothetical protein like AT1G20100 [Hibiscus trionum]|uniref:Uncharacterized protein n=1 Tax=Hibiscus trionum TaxID=183268 RepID=A0A9W7J2N6_HIBTR|nr:hypothetical protein like AT1G20100 [Hibiscus trionum]
MSRCFPYPPPGHLKQGLVESIKLERERVDEDQLEKSDLTEEHEHPVCYISDGSQNSHKRKRETVPHSECRVDGKKIKIRFSLKKPCGLDASISKESACSSSGRSEFNQELSSVTSVASAPELELQLDDDRKVYCHSSEPSCSGALVPQEELWHNAESNETGSSSSGTMAKNNKIPKAVVQYKTLIEDWLPPLLLPELNDYENGDDWLLPKKLPGKLAKRLDGRVLFSDSISWPRAHYILEAEIYALPYTVPF